MAIRYVRSGATGAANGTTWADAYTTMAAVAAVDTAGDEIYVADDHSESTAGAVTIALAGSSASPTKLVCANDTATPPTSVATTGIVAATSGANLTVSGSAYVYGIDFRAEGAASGGILLNNSAPNSQEYENCIFRLTLNATRFILAGTAATSAMKTDWVNCSVSFNGTAQRITPVGYWQWLGGSLIDGGADPTSLISLAGSTGRPPVDLVISGVDLSAAAAGVHIFDTGSLGSVGCRAIIRNSKMPTSWSGNLASAAISQPGVRCELYNCDSGDSNYTMQIASYAGSVVQETVVVRTGGASDGTTSLAWKCVTSANSEYPHITLDLPEIVQWNETTGSSVTATIEIVTDNVTLTDAECWVDVQYLGTSGVPLGAFVSDAKTDVLATAANQTSSSETWTTTGLGTPVKQKLSVTFTPQEKGFIHAVVKLAKASTTVYVDPLLTVA